MNKFTLFIFVTLLFSITPIQENQSTASQPKPIEKWDFYEISLAGPDTGNPFIDVELSAVFKHGDHIYEPEGFYDGDGIYKIRFMPNVEGTWTYRTKSNCEKLNNKQGRIECIAPSPNNHGPVRVKNKYHFAYEDGTSFFLFGTTIYEWPFQSKDKRQQTIQNLIDSPFNKARFLAVPPWRQEYVEGPNALDCYPFEGTSKENWNFSRFNPVYFQRLEQCVLQLRDIGVEADFILFRPYDHGKWGFDMMDAETNDRFVRYVVTRFAAFRNIWWSLANENSYMRHLTDADWDRLFQIVQAKDPYQHLRSIHNADQIYNHTHPWVTHVSLQYYMAVRFFGVSPLLRDIYRKPVVHDEINYEGNIDSRWGQLSGEEMVYRFWIAYIGGTYATHGATSKGQPYGDGWISTGGELTGQSPPRITFLRKIIEDGPEGGLNPIDQLYITNMAGKYGEYYLMYFGRDKIKQWDFRLPDNGLKNGMKFKVDLIDTWNMKITPVEKIFEVEKLDRYEFIDQKKSVVVLPGKPYMALRIRRIK